MPISTALLALEASDATVVLTSISLVFGMLVALCLIITVEGKIFDSMAAKKKSAAKAPAKPAAPAPAAKPAAPAAPAAAKPTAPAGIPGEIIAAISAAVTTVLGAPAVIKDVQPVDAASDETVATAADDNKKKRTGHRRGAWGQAGVREHTTPFM